MRYSKATEVVVSALDRWEANLVLVSAHLQPSPNPTGAISMWNCRETLESNGRITKLTVADHSEELTIGDVMHQMAVDKAFRSFFADKLKSLPYTAFRWETPGATKASLRDRFECVVIEDDSLSRQADTSAFADHFQSHPDDAILVFKNLGGDADLIVPRPLASVSSSAYCHLASFVRAAPDVQIQLLLQRVGELMLSRLGEEPIWLNTAGAGVPWLHLRIDQRPKYYRYMSYRTFKSTGIAP